MSDSSQKPILRDATYADLPEINDIYNHAVLNTAATYDEVPQTLQERLHWYEYHLANGYPVVVVTDARNRVLGWGSLSAFHPMPGYRNTVENSIYISERAQGKGFGKMILHKLIECAKEKGYHAMIALIDSENTISVHMHDNAGFSEVGRLKEVGWKQGAWRDVVYMELLLQRHD